MKPIATWNPARDVWEVPGTEGLLCEHLDVYWGTLPTSGMTRAGTAYELPTSEPPTGGPGCSSLLPTPDAYEASRGGSQHPEKRKAGGHSPYLASVVEWEIAER